MTGLINVYKECCVTPYQSIKLFREKLHIRNSVKIGYAGRLDPLASGVLLLMLGDECKNRDYHQDHIKTYNFDLVLGLDTDSLDPLGLIQSVDLKSREISPSDINLNKYLGLSSQKYPLFSSYHINGIPMYKLARKGLIKKKDRPQKDIIIDTLLLEEIKRIELSEYAKDVISRVKKVKGVFRQADTVKDWENITQENLHSNLNIINLTVAVSSGTYIRSLSEDIASDLGTVGLADNIIRKSVGEYKIEDSFRI